MKVRVFVVIVVVMVCVCVCVCVCENSVLDTTVNSEAIQTEGFHLPC